MIEGDIPINGFIQDSTVLTAMQKYFEYNILSIFFLQYFYAYVFCFPALLYKHTFNFRSSAGEISSNQNTFSLELLVSSRA